MKNQKGLLRDLSEQIADKVQEYIDEIDAWEHDVLIWTDGNEAEVNLGVDGDDYPGERLPVIDFIIKNDDGSMSPDYDKIDDYASGWFDLRQ